MQVSFAAALTLLGGDALAGKESQRLKARGGVELVVSVELPTSSATRDSDRAVLLRAARMPKTVKLSAEGKYVTIALPGRPKFSRSVVVNTNGRSTCVRAIARKRGGGRMPITISLLSGKDKQDPCTGRAPAAPVSDLKGDGAVARKACQFAEGKWGCYEVKKAKGT
jgi:hypothetical protein